MKAKLFFLLFLFLTVVSVEAQNNTEKPFRIGFGAMAGLPVGDMSYGSDLAFGADIQVEYAVVPAFAVTLSAGYFDWAGSWWSFGDQGMIPVLAGMKYNFTDRFYGSAQAGLTFPTQSGGSSPFTFAPGVGFKISKNFDLLFKYQSAIEDGSDMSFLGLRVGITF
jgi:hypothetical protein